MKVIIIKKKVRESYSCRLQEVDLILTVILFYSIPIVNYENYH